MRNNGSAALCGGALCGKLGTELDHGLIIYRRNMPHWRLTGSFYFVTWRLHRDQPDLTEEERTLVASAIKFFDRKRYKLYAYVVMNDHCHVVLQPLGDHQLQQIMYSWKSFTSNQLLKLGLRVGRVWQREYFDRIIRDEDEYWEKVTYIVNNPRKRWPSLTEYKWAEWFPFD